MLKILHNNKYKLYNNNNLTWVFLINQIKEMNNNLNNKIKIKNVVNLIR